MDRANRIALATEFSFMTWQGYVITKIYSRVENF